MLNPTLTELDLADGEYTFVTTHRAVPFHVANSGALEAWQSEDGKVWTSVQVHFYELTSENGRGFLALDGETIQGWIQIGDELLDWTLSEVPDLCDVTLRLGGLALAETSIQSSSSPIGPTIQIDSQVSGPSQVSFVASAFSYARNVHQRESQASYSNPVVFHCTSVACDQHVGMGSGISNHQDLVKSLAQAYYGFRINNQIQGQFDQLIGVTGRTSFGVLGVGAEPGRYALSYAIQSGTYDGRSSTIEQGMNMAHEMGHNYFATHDRASTSSYTYTVQRCAIPEVPIIGCPPLLVVDDEQTGTEHTLMVANYEHEPPTQVQSTEMTQENFDRSRQCVSNLYHSMDYNPNNYDLGTFRAPNGCRSLNL